jgi:hypothetical protein
MTQSSSGGTPQTNATKATIQNYELGKGKN